MEMLAMRARMGQNHRGIEHVGWTNCADTTNAKRCKVPSVRDTRLSVKLRRDAQAAQGVFATATDAF